ncbi:MAG: hypothetical protein ACREHG_11500 [Candidatus Saccharimonadales bacterium]
MKYQKVANLLAATTTLPEDGLRLSDEHDDFGWFMPEGCTGLDTPKKYKTAVSLGGPVFDELVTRINGDREPARTAELVQA